MSDDDALIEADAPKPRSGGWLRYVKDWGLSILVALLVYWGIGWLRAPDLPDEAPDFALQTLEGETVRLSDYRGQTVVVNFWATWCGPCMQEIPTFNEFAVENPDIPILGIATDSNPAKIKVTAKKKDMQYPVLLGTSEVQALYGVTTLPTTVIVGPDGQVEDVHVGIMLKPQLALATR
ncbi:MAG: TlpA disulfide reductase family protein [Myxococcota bacterium]|nr:TlpA disulfide reductase family protein [Myxococcota bacterium]